MCLWVMALIGRLWKSSDRGRAFVGAVIDFSLLSFCHQLISHAVRTGACVRDQIMRTPEAWLLRVSGTTGRGPILSVPEGEGGGGGLHGRCASLMPRRGMVWAEFGYSCQDEMVRFGRCGAEEAVVAASCKVPGAKLCKALWSGPWARVDHSAQSGLRFSRKAVMPSSVSRQSMFSTIVAPVRA